MIDRCFERLLREYYPNNDECAYILKEDIYKLRREIKAGI